MPLWPLLFLCFLALRSRPLSLQCPPPSSLVLPPSSRSPLLSAPSAGRCAAWWPLAVRGGSPARSGRQPGCWRRPSRRRRRMWRVVVLAVLFRRGVLVLLSRWFRLRSASCRSVRRRPFPRRSLVRQFAPSLADRPSQAFGRARGAAPRAFRRTRRRRHMPQRVCATGGARGATRASSSRWCLSRAVRGTRRAWSRPPLSAPRAGPTRCGWGVRRPCWWTWRFRGHTPRRFRVGASRRRRQR